MVAVVIVEGDRLVGLALQRQLRTLGADSRLILDATHVETALETELPDLIIADLWMLGRSGLEVLTMSRQRFPRVRRCLLTGSIGNLRDVTLLKSLR